MHARLWKYVARLSNHGSIIPQPLWFKINSRADFSTKEFYASALARADTRRQIERYDGMGVEVLCSTVFSLHRYIVAADVDYFDTICTAAFPEFYALALARADTRGQIERYDGMGAQVSCSTEFSFPNYFDT